MSTPCYCLFSRVNGPKAPACFNGDTDLPVTFTTLREAQSEMLEEVEEHIRQFRAGERDYGDIMFFSDEWAEHCLLLETGHVIDEDGVEFGKRED